MSNVQPLRLGMFVMPIHDPAKPLAQCIDEDLELAVQCEELGFHDFWVGEHHSSSVENIVMPEIFLGKVLGLTERIRIGPAPVCLQYHHPAHVAGRLAFLDHMSHGRLNVCFGPGAIPTDMEVFGAHPSESAARVAESIDMIMRLWTGEVPIDIEGRFWNVKMKDNLHPRFGVGHLHKPFQRPHPPIYVPSISRASVGLSKAAERGFRFISHHMIHTSRPARAVANVFASRDGGRSNRGTFRLGRGTQRVRRGLDRRCPAPREKQFARLVHPVHPRSDPGHRANGRRHVEA